MGKNNLNLQMQTVFWPGEVSGVFHRELRIVFVCLFILKTGKFSEPDSKYVREIITILIQHLS